MILLPFLCFSASVSCVPTTFEGGPLVCGIEVDGFSGWGGGMTTFSCVDVVGCVGPIYDSGGGGGGGDDGGGGDGVGKWSGVMGLL